jgi:protein translocase SecG subunit
MTLVENIWVLTSVLIIVIILGTDPKNPANNIGNQQMSVFFSSVTDGQRFIQKLNWFLIITFFLLTLSLSYFL